MGIFREHGDPKQPIPGMRMSRPCNHPKSFGSTIDNDNKCPKCKQLEKVDRIASTQTGMWFSASRDPATRKVRIFDRDGESEASKRARQRASEKAEAENPKRRDYVGVSLHEKESTRLLRKALPAQMSPIDEFSEPKSYCSEERKDSWASDNSWSSHGHVEL